MTLSEDLRHAMRQWATGITVVSAAAEGRMHGMTVSSFTSLSLDPPLVLVALYQQSRTHALVQAAGHFGVTILAESQREISDRFAGRVPDDADRFTGLSVTTLQTGAPLLEGGLAWFDCLVEQAIPTGSHTLFVGKVLAARAFAGEKPLLYHDRAYRSLA
ncbi:MAG: flavin reductase [Anaerolineae bacterium]|nr:MAG: flavin reductase [Anaerolineae bacterium]